MDDKIQVVKTLTEILYAEMRHARIFMRDEGQRKLLLHLSGKSSQEYRKQLYSEITRTWAMARQLTVLSFVSEETFDREEDLRRALISERVLKALVTQVIEDLRLWTV